MLLSAIPVVMQSTPVASWSRTGHVDLLALQKTCPWWRGLVLENMNRNKNLALTTPFHLQPSARIAFFLYFCGIVTLPDSVSWEWVRFDFCILVLESHKCEPCPLRVTACFSAQLPRCVSNIFFRRMIFVFLGLFLTHSTDARWVLRAVSESTSFLGTRPKLLPHP